MQQAEVQSSLAAKINETHVSCMMGSEGIRDVILAMVNKARECGIYLTELKEQTPHGQWIQLFSDNRTGADVKPVLHFTHATARNYIRFASANPDEITELSEGIRSVKDAMIASGALPARTHEGQQLHANEHNFFIAAGKQLMAFSTLWEKQMDHHPVGEWSHDTAEQFVAQMEPIIEKVNGIYAQAKERALAHAA